jgi:L-iditol 2-dehydrogenase
MAKNRARVNFFGGLPKDHSIVALDTNIIHYKELFVHGSHGAMPRHHQKAVDLIAAGIINAKHYISHRFPLDKAPEAFAAAEDRSGLRVVIAP